MPPAGPAAREAQVTRIITFCGAHSGEWRVTGNRAIIGEGLPDAPSLRVTDAGEGADSDIWRLRGAISNARYATRAEVTTLQRTQPPLARSEAMCAVLIPIRKSQAWWDLAQDERRAIFEETSGHTRIGLDYLPAVARRLHHGRDLGEPFDFLTWFEFAAGHEAEFDDLTARLRATREWDYVEREVELRLVRQPSA